MIIMKKYFKKLNIFILATLFLLAFALFYFLYYRVRNQTMVYVTLTLSRPKTSIPYWIGNYITVGDREISPLGELNAEVVEKNTYEGFDVGQYVYLLMKMKTVKDRSGNYLFKNKPLSVGSIVDMKLTSANFQAMVISVSSEPPVYEYKKIILTVREKEIWPWFTDSIRVGSEIKDDKGGVIAKILDKKVTIAEVRVDTAGGQATVSYDRRKRDIDIILEIIVKKITDTYYFTETQKVKVNESLFLPFPDVGNLTLPITSIIEIKDFKQ